MSQPIKVTERLARALDRRDGAVGELLEDPAGFRHGHEASTAHAEEELLAELPLQLTDVLRERRL